MKKGCGCGSPAPSSKTDDEYLLVKAIGNSPSVCGDPTEDDNDDSTQCAKSEPEYDSSMSDFVVPSVGGTVSVQVCNAEVYSVNQWIQFSGSLLIVQIVSIVGNTLQVRNACPSGEEIVTNPEAGLLVPRNTRFFTVGAPECISEEERMNQILEALSGAEEICTPDLLESGNQAVVQPVGLVQSDPGNTGFQRCIRRIFGFLMDAGSPFFTQIKNIAESDVSLYRRLGINKSTREVREFPNYGDYAGLTAGSQYMMGVKQNGAEYLIGPSYGFKPMFVTIYENPSDPLSNVTTVTPAAAIMINRDFNLNVPEISGIRSNQDHVWALVHLDLNILYPPDQARLVKKFAVYLNNDFATLAQWIRTSEQSGPGGTQICIPVKINKSDWKLNLKVEQSFVEATGYQLRVYVRGVWF